MSIWYLIPISMQFTALIIMYYGLYKEIKELKKQISELKKEARH